ncbi:MAG: HD domain-containing protein [Endomicrobia bacterium]|nr:HD domain-containing protein [Endomicrobiia bacterium]
MKTAHTSLKVLKKLLCRIYKEFRDCYIVGGLLRDFLLNEKMEIEKMSVVDVDITCKDVTAKKLKRIFSQQKLPFIVLDEKNKVYRTVIKNTYQIINVDITNYSSLDEDISRRDFTINTLYLHLKHFLSFLEKKDEKIILNNLIDKLSAKQDIRNKRLKVVSKNSFIDDPLRILRAGRFMLYGFKLVPSAKKSIIKNRILLRQIAKERINDEIKKIFNQISYKVLEWLDKNKILEIILPELQIAKLKGKNTQFKKFYFHPEGLWQHIKLTYKYVEIVLSKLKNYFPNFYKDIESVVSNKKYLIKYTALFHDIAKPFVVSKEKGRVRFFHHEVKSASIAEKVLKKIKLSNEEIKIVVSLIKNHMRLGSLFNNRENLTDRAYLRLFREMGENLYYLVVFCLADRLSYEVIPLKERKRYIKEYNSISKFVEFENHILNKYLEYKTKISLPRLLTGNDVMKIFNIAEGPLVGKILNFVREAQILGKIATREEALNLARQYIKTLSM